MMSDSEKVKDELTEKLKTISDDKDFLDGVLVNAQHIDDRKAIIEYIDNGKDVSYESLLLLSVWLDKEREKTSNKKIISKNFNKRLKVKFIGEDDEDTLRIGKIYNARVLENDWYAITDESGGEYAFHPKAFEIMEEI